MSAVIIMAAGIGSAQLDLPPGVKAVKEYNQQYAMEFMQTISIPLVFLAGILSLLSPCILPLIPAFFSITFKEKKKITKMTLIFFLGFSIIFVLLGIAASVLGQSIVSLQGNMPLFIGIAGLGLIFFGILNFLGKGFSSVFKRHAKPGNDHSGVFLTGVFFAIGWTACLGPIIAGIMLIAAVVGNVLYATLLLFVYSLGIMAPLLVLSLFYDKINLGNNKWLRGKEIRFRVLGKPVITHTTEMLSGALLIGLGLIFVIFQGTGIINSTSPIGSSLLFNEFQRLLIESPIVSGIIGIAALALLVVGIIVIYGFKKKHI
jgi:cytochrome c-type biogenesis protein